jgi:hypothetical protein
MTEQEIHSLLNEIADYCDLQAEFMQEIVDSGLVSLDEAAPAVPYDTIEQLLRIKRLHDHLGVNVEGIAVILHMRERIKSLQQQMDYLRHRSQDDEHVDRVFLG